MKYRSLVVGGLTFLLLGLRCVTLKGVDEATKVGCGQPVGVPGGVIGGKIIVPSGVTVGNSTAVPCGTVFPIKESGGADNTITSPGNKGAGVPAKVRNNSNVPSQ